MRPSLIPYTDRSAASAHPRGSQTAAATVIKIGTKAIFKKLKRLRALDIFFRLWRTWRKAFRVANISSVNFSTSASCSGVNWV